MVRLTTISNVLSGIGLALLGFSLIMKWILSGLSVTGTSYPYYMWLGGVVLLAVVVIMSVINTFTEITGFVHPEDKLISNMFVYLMAIATVLIFGALDEGAVFQEILFNIASMIVIAYVFLFIFTYFSRTITEEGQMGQVKEMTARFMLVSLVLGGIMAALLVGLKAVWDLSASYEWAAGALGIFAVALVVIIVLALGHKYEPVGE
ncbi:MAG: hypothetical protein K9W43_07300 [Candidatus Thorarchaeota archaeon]|nr:hypothetical protein [Candidatus Thorarchaeota archaeon]